MAEEEFEHDERIANWAAIQNLVEDDAHEKRKLVFSPGVSQRTWSVNINLTSFLHIKSYPPIFLFNNRFNFE